MRVHFHAALIISATCAACAQTTGPSPSFEVASIKPAAPPATSMGPGGGMRMMMRVGIRGGPGTDDPGQITYSGMSMRNLLVNAYGVKTYQISGPSWIDSERFDIVAKLPTGATKDDLKLMLQNLLAERFKLTLHREKKELPMFALVVGKNGPKMKESPPDDPSVKDAAKDAGAAPAEPPKFITGKDGMPQMPGGGKNTGNMVMMMPGRARMNAVKQTMPQFAESLANMLDRPVVDMTGLTKNYDFTLDYLPESGGRGPMGMPPPKAGDGDTGAPEADIQAAPSLFTALQDQLGLKLEQKKGPVDLLVVDRLEKTPTEN